jgi:signal transduction histidine kinase
VRNLVQNLVMNALEHGRGPVEVAVHREDGAVVLWVTAAGPAIPEPLRAALFEPHVSGSDGHGLGLHIARRAAEGNGGTLALRREPGGRNRFEVVLRGG